MGGEKLLEVIGVSKSFPGVAALEEVSFDVKKGEIHCLVGENGAGKSTLIKILSGLYPHGSYRGKAVFDGKEIKFNSPNDSRLRGISTIYQELPLVEQLDIAENISMGSELSSAGIIDSHASFKRAKEALKEVGLEALPDTLVLNLGVGQQQLVAIAKALSQKAKLIILDEPTASLSEEDSSKLIAIMKELKAKGVASLYISHRLGEIFAAADRVTVLRDGKSVKTYEIKDLTEKELIHSMVGRELTQQYPRKVRTTGDRILSVDGLTVKNREMNKMLDNISFELKKGEILGFTGLVGAGRSELVMSLFGLWGSITSGSVSIDGKPLAIKDAGTTIASGIGLVPEDRKRLGLVLIEDIKSNVSLASLRRISSAGVVDEGREILDAEGCVKKLNIRTPSIEQEAMNLSGGNQQKVVLGKWMMTSPKVLVFDEPTRGIDVGAKTEIYSIINDLVDQGIGVIIISSDLPEVLGICDRIVVMCDGTIAAEMPSEGATQEKIMYYATGGKGQYGTEKL